MLEVLKNDRCKDREKKIQSEDLLGPLTDERFALYVNLAKKITDFGNEGKTQITGMIWSIFLLSLHVPVVISWSITEENTVDETYGINVQFEESEEEDDEDVYGEVRDVDEMEEEGEEAKLSTAIHAENVWNLWILIFFPTSLHFKR